LWHRLRAKQLAGIKFRRQEPIGRFIVDLVSFEKRVVIELDGGQHARSTLKDLERDAILEQRGFTVLRFWNDEGLENLEGVLDAIREACSE
jgi:very-short-patch-repair endonuclease